MEVTKVQKKSKEDTNPRKALSELLRELGLIDKGFCGRIILHINTGHISTIERVERIK